MRLLPPRPARPRHALICCSLVLAVSLGLIWLIHRVGFAADPTQSQTYVLQAAWGGQARPGVFLYPEGLDVDTAGRMYIADRGNDRVQVLQANGGLVYAWGSRGSGPRQFREPHDVALDLSRSRLYVTDGGNARVQILSLTGDYLGELGRRGVGPGELIEPLGVAVAPDGNVYVTDRATRVVQVFAPTGEPVRRWGGYGNEPGQFLAPHGITVNSDGEVFVADPKLTQVKQFNAIGTHIRTWTGLVSGARPFQSPTDVAVDTENNLYVLERGTTWVQMFAPNGAFVRLWNNPLVAPLAPSWTAPGLAVRNLIYVSEGRPPNAVQAGGWGHGVARLNPEGGITDNLSTAMSAGDGLRWPATLAYADNYIYVADGQTANTRLLNYIRVFNTAGALAETRTWSNWIGQVQDLYVEGRRLYLGISGGFQIINDASEQISRYNIAGEPGGVGLLTNTDGLRFLFGGVPRLPRLNRYGLDTVNTIDIAPPFTPTPALWPLGLTIGQDNLVRINDPLRQQIETFNEAAELRNLLFLEQPWGARHIAMDPAGNLYALLYDGRVRKYRSDGALLAEFSVPQQGVDPALPVAVAGAETGRAFVLDRANGLVLAFVPGGGSNPTLQPTPTPGRCRVEAEQSLDPPVAVVGQPVTVTLTLRGTCTGDPIPADVVIGLSYSEGRSQERVAVANAFTTFMADLDTPRQRVGLVIDNPNPLLASPLMTDTAPVSVTLNALAFPEAGRPSTVLDLAQAELAARGRSTALPSVVLITDNNIEPVAFYHSAQTLQARGARVYVVAYGGRSDTPLMRLAASPHSYHVVPNAEALPATLSALGSQLNRVTARRITVRHLLANPVQYNGSSLEPYRISGGLGWYVPALTDTPFQITFQIIPATVGNFPVTVSGLLDYTDERGLVNTVAIAPAILRVGTPTATPTLTATPLISPTITETPTDTPTSTPSATATVTLTPMPTVTPTLTETLTLTPTATATATPTATATVSATPTITVSATPSPTSLPTDTTTPAPTATLTPSATTTVSATPTLPPPDTATPTATPTFSPTPFVAIGLCVFISQDTNANGIWEPGEPALASASFAILDTDDLLLTPVYVFTGQETHPVCFPDPSLLHGVYRILTSPPPVGGWTSVYSTPPGPIIVLADNFYQVSVETGRSVIFTYVRSMPTPTPTPTPTLTATPTVTVTPTPLPTVTPTFTPLPTLDPERIVAQVYLPYVIAAQEDPSTPWPDMTASTASIARPLHGRHPQ